MTITCKVRRHWTALRIFIVRRRKDAWQITEFTGHDWQEITMLGNTQLNQCNSCKSIQAILHL